MDKKEKTNGSKSFMFYPDLTDPHFYEKIYLKKEFRDYEQIEQPDYSSPQVQSGDIYSKHSKYAGIKLTPFQSFVRNYINPDTPYNGILVFHGVGVGKTCAAISIAEGFKQTLRNFNKKILILSNLHENFRKTIFDFKREAKKKSPEEIVQCTGSTYQLGRESSYLTQSQKVKEIKKIIKSYYQFFGYTQFANYIVNHTGGWDGSEEQISEQIKKYISKEFDDRVIIIDEIQNIKTDKKKEYTRMVQPILEAIVKYAKNVKLVLMSATPMYDRPDEIIFYINLLLANDGRPKLDKNKIFNPKNGNLLPGAEDTLRDLFRGYVSFVRGEKPFVFPFRFYPPNAIVPKMNFTMSGLRIEDNKKMKYTPIVPCPMKSVQENTYIYYFNKKVKEGKVKKEYDDRNLAAEEEEEIENLESFTDNEGVDYEGKDNGEKDNNGKEKNNDSNKKQPKGKKEKKSMVGKKKVSNNSELIVKPLNKVQNFHLNENELKGMSVLNDLIKISNIVFPVADYNNKNENVISPIGSFAKSAIDTEVDNGMGGYYRTTKLIGGRKKIKYCYQSHAIFNKDTAKECPFADEQYLGDFSTKFNDVLQTIKKSKGLIFVYSQFIEWGALPFALMLEQNGFDRECTDGEEDLLDYHANKLKKGGKRRQICYWCSQEASAAVHHDEHLKDFHTFRRAKYILYFGETKDIIKITRDKAVDKFCSPNNMRGEEIKVFIGTKAVSEGLDFSRVRQIHILDPWYNLSRHEQIIGRGIRFKSHIELKKEERNVEIFQYAAILDLSSKSRKGPVLRLGKLNIEDNSKAKKKDQDDSKKKVVKRKSKKKLLEEGKQIDMFIRETVDLKNYRIAENKDVIIKKINRVLKEAAVDCILFKNSNIIDDNMKVKQITASGREIMTPIGDKNFTSMCDYQDCNFKCAWEPNPRDKYPINTDTYNIRFAASDIDNAKAHIKNLFRQNPVYHLQFIEQSVKKEYPTIDSIFIFTALEQMLENKNEIILDKFSRKGYIIYRGDYYVYQPFDVEREDLPIIYREDPLDNKPKYIDLENIEVDYKNESEKSRYKKDDKSEKTTKEKDNKNERNIFEYFMRTIDSNWNTHKNILYGISQKEPDVEHKKFYFMALVGMNYRKLNHEQEVNILKSVLKLYNNYEKTDIITEQHLKWFVDYINNKNMLIDYYKDIQHSKSSKKHLFVGFIVNKHYFISSELNTGENISTINTKSMRFVPCSRELIARIKSIKHEKHHGSHKSEKFNNIYGFVENDVMKDKKKFKIVNKSDEEEVYTKVGKKSKSSIYTGRECKTMQFQKLIQIRDELKMIRFEGQPKIDFVCQDIEIFLRYKNYLADGKLIYFKNP